MAATLADLLEHWMARRQMSLGRLAAASGVPKANLDRWRTGKARHPHIAGPLLRVARALDLNRLQTSQLLRSAGYPPLDALVAGLARPAREELRETLSHWEVSGPHNLPRPLTTFVGREDELLALGEAVCAPDTRLLTLTGPGGVGKTRLALAVAEALLDAFPDGVYFVALDAIDEAAQFPVAVAQAVDLALGEAPAPLDRLRDHLRGRAILLVLDNAEHLPEVGLPIAALLRHLPHAKALVTSRTRLNIGGEYERRVAPLPLPDAGAGLRDLRENPAVALFVERARARAAGFALARDNAAAILALCARLEGMPLALELAAARLGEASPGAVLASLTGALDLDGGPLDAPPRQRSLRGAIAWSDRLLAPAARRLLRGVAIFAGGFTAEAAGAVVGPEAGGGDAAEAGLAALCDASLLGRADGPDGAARYTLLGVIREYALERLREGDAESALRARHLAWFRCLVNEAAPHLEHGPGHLPWLRRLGADDANLRAALDWALAHGPAGGLALAGALWPYWLARRDHAEGRRWLAALLEGDGADAATRARARYGLGYLTIWHDLPLARRHLEGALALAADRGDDGLRAAALPILIYALFVLGERAALAARVAEAEGLLSRRDDDRLRGMLAAFRGYAAEGRGDLPGANHLLGQALAIGERAHFPLLQCIALARLGMLKIARIAYRDAAADFERLRAVAGAIGADYYAALADHRLGIVAEFSGDLAAAGAIYRRCRERAEAQGDPLTGALSVAGLGRVALRDGKPARAAELLCESLRRSEALRDPRVRGESLRFLWLAQWRCGERAAASATLRDCLTLWQSLEYRRGLVELLELAAPIVAAGGDARRAATWLGLVDAQRLALGVTRPSVDVPEYAATIRRARGSLGEGGYAAARRAGRALTLAEARADVATWLADAGASG